MQSPTQRLPEYIFKISDIILKQLESVPLNTEEIRLLTNWRQSSISNEKLYTQIINGEIIPVLKSGMEICDEAEREREMVVEQVIGQLFPVRGKRVRLWLTTAAAAAAIVVISVVIFFVYRNGNEKPVAKSNTQSVIADKAPGRSGAVLTLASGKEIVLDEASNGIISNEGNADIIKRDSLLSYRTNNHANKVLYNTLSTPRGRQFQLVLPDGSKVWMNAASSLRFPTAFTGKEREVELTGEAFFDVARNEKMPFIVKMSEDTRVQVLGTQFNVMGYADEKEIKTTLVEGSVKIVNGSFVAQLKPNQQALVGHERTAPITVNKDALVEEAVAWRLGLFYFENADLRMIMRQLGRWYDVDVEYAPDIPTISFSGKIRMQSNLSEVLAVLELNGVHFKIQGKKLIVLP